jgi:GNAT superfamily N-acetyltransferase/predicted N-acetyltransferase YhbS
MAALRVADVTDAASAGDRAAFHAVAEVVYRNEPPGTAPARGSVDRNLSRPSFAQQQHVLVAYDGERVIGRVVARISPVLRDERGRPMGLLSCFETVNEQRVADALFEQSLTWLRDQGVTHVIGPMDGDTWHRYRVNVGPFRRPPFPLEPWNPPYYEELWERAGFRPVESYCSKWIDDVSRLLPNLESGLERSVSRGIRIRGLDPGRLADELGVVHAISSEIFRDAFLYSPIGRDEFLELYSGVGRLLDPELVLFAVGPDGREVGFVFGYADPLLPAVHYKTIGVLAEWRKAAVAAALSHHVYSNALRKGLPGGNHALMRDDNRSQALDQGLGDVFRRYVLYEWRHS